MGKVIAAFALLAVLLCSCGDEVIEPAEDWEAKVYDVWRSASDGEVFVIEFESRRYLVYSHFRHGVAMVEIGGR